MLLPFAFPSKTPGATGFYPYQIDNSLRFDGASKLTATPPSVSNRGKFTISCWVKRSDLGADQRLFEGWGGSTSNWTVISFDSGDSIQIQNRVSGSAVLNYVTSAKYRDTASWYHIVARFDLASTGLKVWVNGEEVTQWSAPTFSTANTFFNSSSYNLNIGYYQGTATQYLSGYMADTHFVDNQALSATDFGELKSGIWVPKEYTGTYGTNGFHLDFADGTSAAALGYDAAGSNNFTPSGIATSDQMLDSPTNNFCTINPLKIGSVTLSEGNLQHQHSGSTSWRGVTPTMHVSSGKWYWEVAFSNLDTPPASTTRALVGIVSENETQTNVTAATYWTGITAEAYGYWNYGGSIWNNNSGTAYGSTWGSATIGIALDLDSSPKTLEFFLNGVSQGVLQDGTNINLGDKAWGPGASTYYSSIASYNFGQFDFTYTPPSDFLPLSSVNLPTPTFDPKQGASPQDAFNVYTDTGANILSTAQSDYSDGLFWIKDYQNDLTDHQLLNTVTNTVLESNTTDAERAYSAPSGSSVAWAWKGGGSSNTFNVDGVGYGTASAAGLDGGTQNPTGATVNTKAGIGIYKYAGDDTVRTIAHGLGVAPSVVLLKNVTNSSNWIFYTNAVDGTMDYTVLNSTNAFAASGRSLTSTTFDHGDDINQGSASNNYIAWVLAEKEGFSKFGSYVGNGVDDGPFVYLGFRPAFIMIKRTSSTMNWVIEDAARSPSNVVDDTLYLNLSNKQDSLAASSVDFLSNGFKIRNAATGWINAPTSTFLYMAFAEQPFRYSNAR